MSRKEGERKKEREFWTRTCCQKGLNFLLFYGPCNNVCFLLRANKSITAEVKLYDCILSIFILSHWIAHSLTGLSSFLIESIINESIKWWHTFGSPRLGPDPCSIKATGILLFIWREGRMKSLSGRFHGKHAILQKERSNKQITKGQRSAKRSVPISRQKGESI